jgi:hypothetical protein
MHAYVFQKLRDIDPWVQHQWAMIDMVIEALFA